jgi:CBS domain containing-hemolysin-like protein
MIPFRQLWQKLAQFLGRFWKKDAGQTVAVLPLAGKNTAGIPWLTVDDFVSTVIREIMVPRTDMVAASLASGKEDLEQLVEKAGHSRIPIYQDTIDHIVGILHVKDLVAFKGDFDLSKLLRPTFYVPEMMKIAEVMREFQRRKTHLAIVVDEYGGTAGIVTLEDIIEELVGEIQDEYDVDEHDYRIINGKILARGQLSLWELKEKLGIELPKEGEYETLAGFLTHRIGSLPMSGCVVRVGKYIFTVKEAGEKHIESVEIDTLNGRVAG